MIKKKSPFIIAEIGSNHNQDLNTAYKLIKEAKNSGANAVKFQIFKAEDLYNKKGKIFNIFKKNEFNLSWYPKIKKYCLKNKIKLFASPFGKKSIDFLIKNKVEIIKWASSELTKLNNLYYAANFKKPILLSTGMATINEISEAIEVCRSAGNNKIYLMHCRSLYPTLLNEADILTIKTLKKIFNLPLGYSDHTKNSTSAIVAVGLGATFFEKHITLDKSSPGPDHFYALEPSEFKEYCLNIKDAFRVLGSPNIKVDEKIKATARKKSLFFNKNLKKGILIQRKHLKIKDNAMGIEERFIGALIGNKLQKNVKKNQPVSWHYFK